MANISQWESILQKTVVNLKTTFAQLHKLWEEMGLSKQTQAAYTEQAYEHINDLLSDMVAESEQRKETLLQTVQELLKKAAMLNEELGTNMVTTGYEHLPLNEVEETLRNDVQSLQIIKQHREAIFKDLLAKERDICKQLGTQPINVGLNKGLPSENEINNFKVYLEAQEAEKTRLETMFNLTRRSIMKMVDNLGIIPSLHFEQLVYNYPERFIFTSNNMTKLKNFCEELKDQVEQAEKHAEQLRQNLMDLWKNLQEPSDACQAFLHSYSGFNSTTINALTAEIKRCKEKRRENISKYVEEIRLEITEMWNLCKYDAVQRNHFSAFYSQTYTEDLLTLHELEKEKLRKFYESNKEIYENLNEMESLLEKMRELLQRENNPDRFHNRGGQLLAEERERKIIQKKLPKIEEHLRTLINAYEMKQAEPFTINGMSFNQYLDAHLGAIDMEKETIKKAKMEARVKSAKKTLSASKRTPMMTSTRVQTSVRVTKRKLAFGPSPNVSLKRRSITRKQEAQTNRAAKCEQNKAKSGTEAHCSTDTSYQQFQEHLKTKEDLRSSLLPEQVLRNSNKSVVRTPVRTPAKPIRKRLTPSTPVIHKLQPRKALSSPRIVRTPRFAPAPSVPNIPNIF